MRTSFGKKDTALSLRVPEPIKKATEKAARDDDRSVTGYVQKVLTNALRTGGYLK